jgi:restriction endonuclease S subunit
MSDISIVNSYYVVSKERLDAEYYRQSFLEVERKLSNLPCERLKRLAESIEKGIFYILAEEYQTTGIPFLRVSNIGNPFIEKKDLVYISPEKNAEHKSTSLKPEDVVISKGGTIGYVAIITPDIGVCNISQDIIGVKNIKKAKISPYFLTIFLLTKYGQNQLLRGRSQQVQAHLTLDIVRNLLIPILPEDFQLHIEQFIKQAYEKRKLADQKYQQIEEKFYELLGIGREEIEKLEIEKVYETNFKEVRQAFRFDAEHYHPKYYFLNRIFEKLPSITLGDNKYFELKKGIEVGSNVYCDKEKGVLFLRVSNLSKEGLKINPVDKYILKGIYNKLKSMYEPKKGEVLFSKDGTIGTAVVVDSDFPPSIISGGIVRIYIKKDFDPYYLAFVLNSIITELQIMKEKTGSVIEHLRFSKLKEIRVPKFPQTQQQEIAELVKDYLKLRKESRQLVQRAIREVEEAIENAPRTDGEQ